MLQLILAAILALPALLFSVISSIMVGLLSLPSIWLLKFRKSNKNETININKNETININIKTQHAIITGGSSGIGFAVAKECVKRGMDCVTILARNEQKLIKAKQELEAMLLLLGGGGGGTTKIQALSVDVTNTNALALVAPQVLTSSNETAYLFCCAGYAQPGAFTELPSSVFAEQMNTNYLGSVHTVHAFLPLMTQGGGTIVLTSSAGGQVGVFGYTAYTPTKFALRGFAESLHMELLNHDKVHVQLVFPPDTDTPGFTEENKHKPRETQLISETLGLVQPQEVGRRMVQEAIVDNPKFAVYFGFEGWMLSTVTAGMSPESSFLDAVAQVAFMSLLRMTSLFVLNDFWRKIRKCQQQRNAGREGTEGAKQQLRDYGSVMIKEGDSKTAHATTVENAANEEELHNGA